MKQNDDFVDASRIAEPIGNEAGSPTRGFPAHRDLDGPNAKALRHQVLKRIGGQLSYASGFSMLQSGRGSPGAPHRHASGPSHGRPGVSLADPARCYRSARTAAGYSASRSWLPRAADTQRAR
jgi:hypothetical protein